VTFLDYLERNYERILWLTVEHLLLSLEALAFALPVGLVLGILLSRVAWLRLPVLGLSGVIYTIPSLALFGMMIPFFGIGTGPAIVALVLYVQFVLIRNTLTGIRGVDPAVIEAARGMGMGNLQILLRVELPLALPIILAGVRIAMVFIVAIATIAAWIGAGGLGTLIVRGLNSLNVPIMLAGAVPACLLAVALDQGIGIVERSLQHRLKGRQAAGQELATVRQAA